MYILKKTIALLFWMDGLAIKNLQQYIKICFLNAPWLFSVFTFAIDIFKMDGFIMSVLNNTIS